jgi:NADP-dependent 3-hydroxy acid dehydrogenase YdfG
MRQDGIYSAAMTNHLDGRVVVITGAGSGFGRLVAEMTAARGARVVAADVDPETAAETVERIHAAGGEARAVVADVTDRSQMHALAAAAVDAFGAIDVMVNNAGIMPLAFIADHAIAADAWDRCIDINVKGVLNGIIAVHDQMIEQGRGHVVNISSIYGNFPNAGAGVYTASKAAVNILSETLRVESQGKIKVTVVKPTGVPTTNLSASVINPGAIVGIVGDRHDQFMRNAVGLVTGELPAPMTDRDDPRYWTLTPEDLAEQIVYAIDQPWGVSISDITIRATGEDYVL